MEQDFNFFCLLVSEKKCNMRQINVSYKFWHICPRKIISYLLHWFMILRAIFSNLTLAGFQQSVHLIA